MGLKSLESKEPLPMEVEKKLRQCDAVFQKPTGLPLVRGREHGIVLQYNTKPISVRPYRYPMHIMEQMVQEMLAEEFIRPLAPC